MSLTPIGQLLLHRPPMLLVDRLEHCGDDRIVCSAAVASDSPFADCGRVPALLAVEYMAQCVGAYVGLQRRARGEQPRLGFLVGVRDLELLCESIDVGQRLTIESKLVWLGDNVGQFDCGVRAGDRELAKGRLNVYEAPEG